MSDELSIRVSMSFKKSGAECRRREVIDVDVTGDAFSHEVQSIGTTEEALAQGAELGTPGYVMIINLDSTNYLRIGSTTGVYDIRINAGEVALYRHNSATIYAIADTASVLCEYVIIEA